MDWIYDDDIRKEVLDPFYKIADALNGISNMMFDTLGSAQSGDALRGLSGLSSAVYDLCNTIETHGENIADAIKEET